MKARIRREPTADEKRIITRQIRADIAEQLRESDVHLFSMILWLLHKRAGHGAKRLKADFDVLDPLLDELLDYYEADKGDEEWVCCAELGKLGVDVRQWVHDSGRRYFVGKLS